MRKERTPFEEVLDLVFGLALVYFGIAGVGLFLLWLGLWAGGWANGN